MQEGRLYQPPLASRSGYLLFEVFLPFEVFFPLVGAARFTDVFLLAVRFTADFRAFDARVAADFAAFVAGADFAEAASPLGVAAGLRAVSLTSAPVPG
jgi:hypothetical protein